MEDLKQFRDKIDEIDKELVRLFEERMNMVIKVAEYKKVNNISVLNQVREADVIEKNKQFLKNAVYGEALEIFFIHLMALSKNQQYKFIEKELP